METKESVSTELDPNVAVEDLVTVLNDAVGDGLPEEPEQYVMFHSVVNLLLSY